MLSQGNQGQTGKQTGQGLTLGFGEFSEATVTELMPRYYENTYRGQKFSVLFAAAVTGAASTSALDVLINPSGSGKNLVILDSTVVLTGYTAQTLIGSGVELGWFACAVTPGTIGTLIVPTQCFVGNGGKSVAIAAPTATILVAPAFIRQIAGWTLGTATPGADVVGVVHDDVAGAIIIAPGYGIAFFGLGGTPADLTIQPTLTWDEVTP
jgi:hypothetical protein